VLWFTPVILATQEGKIRITVQSQTVQIVFETLSKKKKIHNKGLVEWLKQ
jgi:hypothetical protein